MNKEEREQKIRDLADKFKAKILVYAISIELMLTSIIISRFTRHPKEAIEYILYFENTSFERKIKLVELILKSNYTQLLENYRDMFIQLKQIRDVRNRISHHQSSFEDNGQEIVFVLSPSVVKIKMDEEGQYLKENVEKFSKAKMDGLMKMVEVCDAKMREIIQNNFIH